jgi:1-deoxy-D-xylulose-5-phosphate synthase
MSRKSKPTGDGSKDGERDAARAPEPPQLLDRIDGPEDLRGLSEQELAVLAQEVRKHIIDTVGEIGGHFGANLGTCELAVALHSLLESPKDKILWDVGHQAYPHKILTGRRDRLGTIRQYGGLAPFCSIEESPHDIMGAGHASTSIGYAVGIKEGMRQIGGGADGKVVAVIGDGAMTGGVAFEAIGQAGGLGTPMVVVLNDNGMSIAPNVGALSRYFNRVRLNPKLWHARAGVEGGLTRLPGGIGSAVERLGPQLKESIKAFWAPGLWWEELDWAYMGVVDGHDVHALREALSEALAAERPVVVHIATVKGKGFAPAEDGGLGGHGEVARGQAQVDPQRHPGAPGAAAGQADGEDREALMAAPQYTQVFGEALVRECERDERVVGITAAMNSGTGLNILQKAMPERYFDVGIAEQQAILFAAGTGARGGQAGGRDLLDLPAARLRPDRARRVPAETQRRVRDGSRWARRRRRADAPRGLRHRLSALPSEHRPDGAARRGDARAHAAHGARLRRRPDRIALSRAERASAWRCRRSRCAIPIGTGEILREGGAGETAGAWR